MRLSSARRMLSQNLLTTERAVASTSPIRIAAYITINVTYVVPVLLVERVVINFMEALSPEDKTFLEVQTDALQEQAVLQTAKMLEMSIAAEGAVQVRHARWEVLRQVVDVGGCDLGAIGGSGVGGVGGVGSDEVLGEVVEDRRESVIFVKARESAGG